MTTRAPKAGDFVLGNSWLARPGVYRGVVRRVVRATASTAWLDNDDTIKAERGAWMKDDPWHRVVYVPEDEARRWMAARVEMTAWEKSIPDGAKWCTSWGGDKWLNVSFKNDRIDTAEEADQRAAIFVAVAAWLRAKPDEESLLIRIGGEP